ncbi:polysaccharide deacetylase family protein [Granulicoccus sp. GXG6511]|uniref:polysaccharide deacetylase family protein n=1 Tax=Granulicoccus sp. GXG6511 TaxID=3381351 RepID=UPI003D7C9A16
MATTWPVRSAWMALTPGRVRILAYHGVEDLDKFERAVDRICERFTPVSGSDIARALNGGGTLPRHAVWFTFDDGLATTLAAGEMLANHGISATVFVNPATMERPGRLWFQTVDEASRAGLISTEESERFSHGRLKRIPDAERRLETAVLEARLTGREDVRESLTGTLDDLNRWVSLGHEIGNHTWDHPCLDQCSRDEQEDQIRRAHEWFVSRGLNPQYFAYPNGDWIDHSAAVARDLDYVGSVLFDHRLANLRADQHRLSRLRINSDASIPRVDAILSGAHSGAYALMRS